MDLTRWRELRWQAFENGDSIHRTNGGHRFFMNRRIVSALERAEHLVVSTEGSALSPGILEVRGRLAATFGDAPSSDRTLREALDLYRAIGATGHAERLAPELDA